MESLQKLLTITSQMTYTIFPLKKYRPLKGKSTCWGEICILTLQHRGWQKLKLIIYLAELAIKLPNT